MNKTKKITKKSTDSKTISDLIKGEKTPEKTSFQKMADKLRKVCGDDYVFILFESKYPPVSGDSITVGNLKAIFKKIK